VSSTCESKAESRTLLQEKLTSVILAALSVWRRCCNIAVIEQGGSAGHSLARFDLPCVCSRLLQNITKDAFCRSGVRNIFWPPRSATAGANVLLSPSYRPTAQAYIYIYEDRDSAVGIATRYGLDARDRILVGPRISAPVQTGPVGLPNLLYYRYRLLPGGKAAGRGVDNPPHIAPWLKKE